MPATMSVEERLTSLENIVWGLQRQIALLCPKENWLDKVIGSISDPEAFEEAMALGRQYRQSDRPPDEVTEKP